MGDSEKCFLIHVDFPVPLGPKRRIELSGISSNLVNITSNYTGNMPTVKTFFHYIWLLDTSDGQGIYGIQRARQGGEGFACPLGSPDSKFIIAWVPHGRAFLLPESPKKANLIL